MGSFIAKQPNGLYCRFSSIVDCPTHWNMTEEDYIEYRAEEAREDARETLQNHLKPFEWVTERFLPYNMTKEEFQEFLNKTKESESMLILQQIAIVPEENLITLIDEEICTSIKDCPFDEIQEFDYAQTALLDVDRGYIIYWNDNIHCNPNLYIDAFTEALSYSGVDYKIKQVVELEDDFKNKKYNGETYL